MNRIFFYFVLFFASVAHLASTAAFAQTSVRTSEQSTSAGSARAGSFTLKVTAAGQPSPPSQAKAGRFTLSSGYLYTLARPTAGNSPPVVASAIANQTLTVGGINFTQDLRDIFTDPDGDPLLFTANSSSASIATAIVSANTLTVAPVAAGNATITVTASDEKGGLGSTIFNATVIEFSTPVSDTARAGESLVLSISISDNFQPTSQRLFFRKAGQSQYDSTALTQVGNDITGSIPADFVTERGIEYYIFLSDGQTVVTFPETDPVNNPAVIPVQVDLANFPLGVQAQTFRMISIPLTLSNPQIDSVLADDYGAYASFPQQWRLFRWQGNDYAEHPAINTNFTPGTGFWLISRQGIPFNVRNAQSVNSAQAFTITLEPNNWTQIATPFAFSVAWDSVLAASGQVASQQVQAPVLWNGTDYEYNQTTLQPWEGYFVFNLNTTPVQLSVPPRESQGSLPQITDRSLNENLIRVLSRLERRGSGSNLLQLSENEFIVQIKAQGMQSGWKDEQNFIGMLAGATDGLDQHDFLEAPPIGDYIRLSIVDQNHIYAGNFRAISKTGGARTGGVWDLQLSTTGAKENIRLTLIESQKLPDGFEIWLLDTNRQSSLPISQGQVELEIAPKGATTNIRLIVGTPEFANASNEGIPLVPYQFTLHQNYPNPFNPETKIEYELAERSEVRLEIYNILGQKVRSLVNAAQSAGRYSIEWDGRDQNGNAVASAVYVYRLEAGEFVAVRKLVLSR